MRDNFTATRLWLSVNHLVLDRSITSVPCSTISYLAANNDMYIPQNNPTQDPNSVRRSRGITVKLSNATIGHNFQPVCINGQNSCIEQLAQPILTTTFSARLTHPLDFANNSRHVLPAIRRQRSQISDRIQRGTHSLIRHKLLQRVRLAESFSPLPVQLIRRERLLQIDLP